jgi:hypothetical protein
MSMLGRIAPGGRLVAWAGTTTLRVTDGKITDLIARHHLVGQLGSVL